MAIRAGSLRETITVYLRAPSGTDRYNDEVMVDGTGTDIPAAVMPVGAAGGVGASMELEILRDTRISRYVFTVLADANLNALARVVWRGRSFEVIGEPRALQANGSVHHYEFIGEERLG